jgi:hypothetical protein
VSLRATFTGVSSACSTSSAASASRIAPSNPATSSFSANRSWARATNPDDTADPSNAAISIAVRSTGTFPAEDNRIAAAFTFTPYATAPACPNGTCAVVVFPQPQHVRRGST